MQNIHAAIRTLTMSVRAMVTLFLTALKAYLYLLIPIPIGLLWLAYSGMIEDHYWSAIWPVVLMWFLMSLMDASGKMTWSRDGIMVVCDSKRKYLNAESWPDFVRFCKNVKLKTFASHLFLAALKWVVLGTVLQSILSLVFYCWRGDPTSYRLFFLTALPFFPLLLLGETVQRLMNDWERNQN